MCNKIEIGRTYRIKRAKGVASAALSPIRRLRGGMWQFKLADYITATNIHLHKESVELIR